MKFCTILIASSALAFAIAQNPKGAQGQEPSTGAHETFSIFTGTTSPLTGTTPSVNTATSVSTPTQSDMARSTTTTSKSAATATSASNNTSTSTSSTSSGASNIVVNFGVALISVGIVARLFI